MKKLTTALGDGTLTISALAEGIYRVVLRRCRIQRESMLTRYGIVRADLGDVDAREENGALIVGETSARLNGTAVEFTARGYTLLLDLSETLGEDYDFEGFSVRTPLEDGERLFGLGDESRDRLMKRGHTADLWQANVSCYGPIPYVMSSRGWSMMFNTTFRHRYDLGFTKPDEMRVESRRGMLDVYVFLAQDMKGALEKYTRVSGRPVMLPKAAYGLTFVNNEGENARDLLENCMMFRREKIPCDIMGLEPGWMSTHYDFSTEKKWDPERFYMPYWLPENYYGNWSFIYNLHQMGYKLSLWLCCDYDLLWKEENDAARDEQARAEGAAIQDAHFSSACRMDKLTKQGEDWFEHLKKFVDNGADAFKLDGANQVVPHPDRLFADRYTDEEVHNVYPVIYGKQMKQGFAEYTGRRAMIYTPAMYAGQQQFCATWAGDTGGGPRTLISIMNLALCGHANASCDMDVTDLSSMHYCTLMPWTQHMTWRTWDMPWFLGDEREEEYRAYAQMRSELFPYIYATAHQANETGLPIVRPLALAYEDHPEYDDVLNEYMLGDSLLVAAFDLHMTLPEGRWTDVFTGKTYAGGASITYDPPRGKGGAIMAKDGAIIVTRAWMPHITHHEPSEYTVHVYPGANGAFTLYDDDGETYGYEKGQLTRTRFTLCGDTLTIGRREGCFENMPALVPFEIRVHNPGDRTRVLLDGTAIDCRMEGGCLCFRVPVSLHEARTLSYTLV